MKLAAFLACSLVAAVAHADAPAVPPDLQARWDKAKLGDTYVLDQTINPWYLRGDLDGDGKADYVVGVTKLKPDPDADPLQIVVLFGGKLGAKLVPDDDRPARDGWYVVPKKTKLEGGPKLKYDGFEMWKAESSSGVIYWNSKKKKFITYWTSD